MTFSEFKFSLKREKPIGSITFYTVPKTVQALTTFGETNFMKIPYCRTVNIHTNKYGKKILDFESGFGADAADSHFFFEEDKELAEAYTVKLQLIEQERLITALKDFESETKINTKLDIFLDKYPEIYL